MNAGRARALAGLGLVALAAACGRKDNPLPPLHLAPGRVADTRLLRIDDRVEVRFTIPAANADGSTPPILDRIEIYALATPAGASAPTLAQAIDPSHLKGQVAVRHETAKQERAREKAGAPPDPRPAPGDAATFVDRAGTDRHGDDAPVLYYVVVGVTGKSHKGQAAGPFEMPLAAAPPVPRGLVINYDEQTLTLAWQPGAPGRMFRVYQVDAAGAILAPPGPLQSGATFAVPVEFDKPLCLTVRAVQETGPTTVEGAAAPPQCTTPVDTFPPPAPSGLLAFSGADGSVDLTWDAVQAKDLAGYVVLRGDGSGDRLLPLMTKVIPDLHYTDHTVTRGMTYSYVVRAEDAKGNASGPSNRQQVTVSK